MCPKEQLSVLPELLHAALAGLIVQVHPAPGGGGALSVSALGTPGPALCTLIVKPMFDPALTDDASATLVIDRFGQLTIVEADACALPALVADAIAVLL